MQSSDEKSPGTPPSDAADDKELVKDLRGLLENIVNEIVVMSEVKKDQDSTAPTQQTTQADDGSSSADTPMTDQPSDKSASTAPTPETSVGADEPKGSDSPTSGSGGGEQPPNGGGEPPLNGDEKTPSPKRQTESFLPTALMTIAITGTAAYFLFIRSGKISLDQFIDLATLAFVIVAAATILVALTAYALSFFDIFFTQVPSGEIKFVVKGETCHRAIASVVGWTIDGKTGDMRKLQPGESDPNLNWLSQLGIFWIGIWPLFKVFNYKFSWDKPVGIGEGSDKQKIFHRENIVVDSLLFRYPYAIRVSGSETGGYISYDILLVVTTLALNPITAIFGIKPSGSWITILQTRVQDAVRSWVSKQDVKSVLEIMNDKKSEFTELVTDYVNQNLVDLIGVAVAELRVVSVDPVIEDQKIRDALTEKVRAEEQGKADVVAAEFKAQAQRIRANAVAYEITQVASANEDRIKRTILTLLEKPDGIQAIAAEALRDGLVGNRTATTLVLGGQAPGLMINSTSSPSQTGKPTSS